jgi:uncharacterized membrane protein YukC
MSISGITATKSSSVQMTSNTNIDAQINQLLSQEQGIQKQLTEVKNDKTLTTAEKTKQTAELNKELEKIKAEIEKLKAQKTKTGTKNEVDQNVKDDVAKKDLEHAFKTGVVLVVDENV